MPKRRFLSTNEKLERKFYYGLRSALRRLWMWYSPQRKAALADASVQSRVKCAKCLALFYKKDVAVDHIIPCGGLKAQEDIAPFVARLMVGADGLQILCREKCHAEKSKKENADRRRRQIPGKPI